MRYVAELLDGDGVVVEAITTPSLARVEDFVRTIGDRAVVVDDARYDGDGSFVPGSIHWYIQDDDT